MSVLGAGGTQSKAGTRIQGQASFQVEDDATKKAVGATLDAMKPLLRNSKGAEKTPKRKGQDENNNNNNNGQSKEKSEAYIRTHFSYLNTV